MPPVRQTASEFFLGHFTVALEDVEFETGVRDYDVANVDRLHSIFRTEGCHRTDPLHFVPAIIPKHQIDTALRDRQSIQRLHLPAGIKLHCLHGKHRVLAAKRFFPKQEQWWTATLYDARLPPNARLLLIEEYKNEQRFADGDVYRYYRYAQIANDQASVKRWLARLSSTKVRNLQQLEKADHGRVLERLDKLLPFVGLWQGFKLGALCRLLPLRTWQEMIHYLNRMLQQWTNIVGELDPSLVTPQTVTSLELRVPALSIGDQSFIRRVLGFAEFEDPGTQRYQGILSQDEREGLMRRLQTCSRILSFRSFFEDTYFLEICHNAVRWLVPQTGSRTSSFETSLRDCYHGPENDFRVSYIEIWLYSMRHFPELTGHVSGRPRKERGGAELMRRGPSAERRQAFAAFAQQHGFQPAHPTTANPILADVETAPGRPAYSTDATDVPVRARCNRPFQRSFEADRRYLFPTCLYSKQDMQCLQYVTCAAIAADIVRCFWPSPSPANDPAQDQDPKFCDRYATPVQLIETADESPNPALESESHAVHSTAVLLSETGPRASPQMTPTERMSFELTPRPPEALQFINVPSNVLHRKERHLGSTTTGKRALRTDLNDFRNFTGCGWALLITTKPWREILEQGNDLGELCKRVEHIMNPSLALLFLDGELEREVIPNHLEILKTVKAHSNQPTRFHITKKAKYWKRSDTKLDIQLSQTGDDAEIEVHRTAIPQQYRLTVSNPETGLDTLEILLPTILDGDQETSAYYTLVENSSNPETIEVEIGGFEATKDHTIIHREANSCSFYFICSRSAWHEYLLCIPPILTYKGEVEEQL
ncbi:hypothetical protein BAUCODRAFT_130484 [Baudoinia panamericana UAMH 10762]|uniref:Uncharacterized protein n=1 Tax=Baudoinia panamericana (strain UAMH 10762) TaxID=717646 RepID=M2NEB5_BAUPA|nr:uncharacterized protein BAUCODRAFT_130484 [Baudoinia panamericana UAMH 10762]EMC97300.1 hypothetical protein BAUCODRAFT_130484 [Baudoinia panamericana UAMH 10762]